MFSTPISFDTYFFDVIFDTHIFYTCILQWSVNIRPVFANMSRWGFDILGAKNIGAKYVDVKKIQMSKI